MPYPYLGTQARTYPAYRDTANWQTLVAEPGGSYDMVPAAGSEDLPVPPQDGCWGEGPDDTAEAREAAPASEQKAAPPGPPQTTSKRAAPAAKGE